MNNVMQLVDNQSNSFDNVTFYGESGYLRLLEHVIENGVPAPDRTGVGVIKTFNHQLVYNIGIGEFPFSTVRPAPLRLAFEEFWFFLRGHTDTKLLEEKGINFWKGNTSREFLNNRGLSELPEGNMGKAYGYQFRYFNDVHDQLEELIDTIRNDPYSRRMLQTFWNPSQSKDMALTPCWHSHQFVVIPDSNGDLTLNLKVYNRSLDLLFGANFAMQQYALYMMCIAELGNFKCGKIVFDLSDVHLYNNQIAYASEVLTRDMGVSGTVEILKEIRNIDDLLNLQWEDIHVDGLIVNDKPFNTKRPSMAV